MCYFGLISPAFTKISLLLPRKAIWHRKGHKRLGEVVNMHILMQELFPFQIEHTHTKIGAISIIRGLNFVVLTYTECLIAVHQNVIFKRIFLDIYVALNKQPSSTYSLFGVSYNNIFLDSYCHVFIHFIHSIIAEFNRNSQYFIFTPNFDTTQQDSVLYFIIGPIGPIGPSILFTYGRLHVGQVIYFIDCLFYWPTVVLVCHSLFLRHSMIDADVFFY